MYTLMVNIPGFGLKGDKVSGEELDIERCLSDGAIVENAESVPVEKPKGKKSDA